MSERYEDELKDLVIDALLEQQRLYIQVTSAQSLMGDAERKLIRVYEENVALQQSVLFWKTTAEEGLGIENACRDAAQNGPTNDEQV